ncbi:MAG: ribokinase [Candidatus Kerfeldbacteria bacterium]|nr:ribokinase [Candidatus Kerfeldbacteria bacterium]
MPTVYVVGTITMDLIARSERFPQPGETFIGTSFAQHPGGKAANQAIASAKTGARTAVIGKVGRDAFGKTLTQFLKQNGVQLKYVQQTDEAPTGVAQIVVADSGENAIVVVPGANGQLTVEDVTNVPVADGDIVLGQLEVPRVCIEALFARARNAGAITILNPSPAQHCPREFLGLADYLIANENEYEYYIGEKVDFSAADAVLDAAPKLRTHAEQAIIVTLGARGLVALSGEERIVIPGHSVKAVDTTGAGDTFAGAFAARLAAGDTLKPALAYANAAAAISVQRPGAGSSIPSADEVNGLLASK